MNTELLEALDALEKEKGISRDAIMDAIEVSLLKACETIYGKNEPRTEVKPGEEAKPARPLNVKVKMDHETGDYELYRELTVSEDVTDPLYEISLEKAREIDPSYQLGDIVRQNIDSRSFGRIATQNAKNVILQKIREQERQSIYDTYIQKEHEIMTGIVQRSFGSSGSISVNLGRAEGILSENEQIPGEHYEPNDRIRVLVLQVKNTNRGPRIFLSRTHPEFVKRLFEEEVTEVKDGTVEIKAIAREAGSRTKMAVWSNDPNVDPVGACVGMNSNRVNTIVDELGGEKIDVVRWSDNSAELIENALSPAKTIAILADDDERTAQVIVPDYQLSLAIGKLGQNARLAARLTGYKIDIKSETQARESGLFDEIGYIEDYEEDGEEDEDEYYDEYDENAEDAGDGETGDSYEEDTAEEAEEIPAGETDQDIESSGSTEDTEEQ